MAPRPLETTGSLDGPSMALAEGLLRFALGELTAEQARARIVEIGASEGVGDDPRPRVVLEALSRWESLARARARREHAATNALAGVLGNLDYVASLLRGESPDGPFLATASRRDRSNVLEAITHATEAGRKLFVLLTTGEERGAGGR